MTYVPSAQQQAYFDFLREGSGSVILEAAAGAGKSTTLVQGLQHMQGTVFLGAYNKKAAEDLKSKVAAQGSPSSSVRVGTMHSAGFGTWRRFAPNTKVSPYKVNDLIKLRVNEGLIPEQIAPLVEKLVSLGKQMLAGVKWKTSNHDAWYRLVDHFGLEADLPEDVEVSTLIEHVEAVFNASGSMCLEHIDFDDMIWAPLAYKARFYQNDWVLCDEAQDFNPSRMEIAKRMLKPGGRLVAVGDSRQGIYGFCHPAGTLILTPKGYRLIETLKAGDPYISVNTAGNVAGWGNTYTIQAVTTHTGWDHILEIKAGEFSTKVTPHHRVPVRMPKGNYYLTYVMRRQGKFRVGYMASHAGKDRRFMLSQRSTMEQADSAWILQTFDNKLDAVAAEARLHALGAFGGSFTYLTDQGIQELPQDPSFYAHILESYGRLLDFPLWIRSKRMHFEALSPAIIEACNMLPGMSVKVLGEWDTRKRGRSRHLGEWEAATVVRHEYSRDQPTYGITVMPMVARTTNYAHSLYIADGITVHNTGAMSESMDQIQSTWNCARLPLSVSYRCPQAVVRHAHRYVPPAHIQAHADAPMGSVRRVERASPLYPPPPWHVIDVPSPDDAVLCRYTAPLVKLAFSMIRHGQPCQVEGRDIGKGLIALVRRWKVRTLDQLEDKLEEWVTREVAKLRDGAPPDSIHDRRDTLHILIDRCRSKGTDDVASLVLEIESLFADEVKGVTTLCTGHKSKGREWPRVYWLESEEREWMNQQPWQAEQEMNVKYVITTRALKELILVSP